MNQNGPNWREVDGIDLSRPNQTEFDRIIEMNQSGPYWTEMDQSRPK